jgi:hypothetical protein
MCTVTEEILIRNMSPISISKIVLCRRFQQAAPATNQRVVGEKTRLNVFLMKYEGEGASRFMVAGVKQAEHFVAEGAE